MWASQVVLVVKNLPANAGEMRCGLIPGLERCLGVGNGSLLQYSCLRNPMYRGTWPATVYGAAKNWTRLSTLFKIIKHRPYTMCMHWF